MSDLSDRLPPRRRDDPEWIDTVVGDFTITAIMAGGESLVPDGRGGMQPLPDDWEEQNGWPRQEGAPCQSCGGSGWDDGADEPCFLCGGSGWIGDTESNQG